MFVVFAFTGIVHVLPAYSRVPDSVSDDVSATDLLRKVIDNEINADNHDNTDWMYKDTQKGRGEDLTREYIETREGDLQRLISMDGEPLNEQQQQEQNYRVSWFVGHPGEARQLARNQEDDAKNAEQMLSLIPKAVLVSYGKTEDHAAELDFRPNPDFHANSHEAAVFHAMAGKIVVDTEQNRLMEIDGYLIHQVNFWHGLLGHLDRGGHFHVVQTEVLPRHWELTRIVVDMRGKALFFKTIGVQQDETRSDFELVPDNVTLAQAAQKLQQVALEARR